LVERVDEIIVDLAIHPSGMFAVTATKYSIKYYAICLKNFEMYQETPVNDCNLIKMSNGGHLLAAQEQNDICVFKFWTGERPEAMRFIWHKSAIIDIQWLKDDSGFVSTAADSTI